FGRQSYFPRISFCHLQVRLDLSFQLPIQPPAPHQRQDTFDSSTPPHRAASRNRATSALACSHFWTSASSCFVPALVNEYNFTFRFVSEIPHLARIQPSCSKRINAG